jgi:hypothetical protein
MMQHSISFEHSHQDQDLCRSPVPQTPQSSWSFLSECPAPPARDAGDFFGMETSHESSNIYLPMLPSTVILPSAGKDVPNLRPRLSHVYVKDKQDYSVISTQILSSSYPDFPSKGTSCPSPAASDDETCSMSDESTDGSFADYTFASEVQFEELSLKDSTLWACPLPSMMHGDSATVRLQPRSLPLCPDLEARGNPSPPLMPMDF